MDGFLIAETNRVSLDFHWLEIAFLTENCSYQTTKFQQYSWQNVAIFGANQNSVTMNGRLIYFFCLPIMISSNPRNLQCGEKGLRDRLLLPLTCPYVKQPDI